MLEKQTFHVDGIDERLSEKNVSHPLANMLLSITDRLFLYCQNNLVHLLTVERSEGKRCLCKILFEFHPNCAIQNADLVRVSSEEYLLGVVNGRGVGFIFQISLAAHELSSFSLKAQLDWSDESDFEEGLAWISFSQDSKYVQISRKLQKKTRIYSVESFGLLNTFDHPQIPRAILFDSNGQLVAAYQTVVDLFSLDKLKCVTTIQSPCNSAITNLFIFQSYLGFVCEDGTCLLYKYSSDGKYSLFKSLSLDIRSRTNWCSIVCSSNNNLVYSASFPQGEIACQSMENDKSNESTSVNRIFGITIVPESEQVALITEGYFLILLTQSHH